MGAEQWNAAYAEHLRVLGAPAATIDYLLSQTAFTTADDPSEATESDLDDWIREA